MKYGTIQRSTNLTDNLKNCTIVDVKLKTFDFNFEAVLESIVLTLVDGDGNQFQRTIACEQYFADFCYLTVE